VRPSSLITDPMAQLVLLVVAAAWAAVLIPPLLRSRIENRPNSSVTDFRRQLNTLQNTSTPNRGSLRMGRPLVQSPLQRPAAAGRPNQHAHHRQASLHGAPVAPRGADPRSRNYRAHGDPSGGHPRPAHTQTHMERRGRPEAPVDRPRRPVDPRSDVRRRRSSVLFLLAVITGCTLFLAATTSSTVLLYVFVLAFLALCGYVYLLAQARQREDRGGWTDDWIERY
jgi:hypothetical protein